MFPWLVVQLVFCSQTTPPLQMFLVGTSSSTLEPVTVFVLFLALFQHFHHLNMIFIKDETVIVSFRFLFKSNPFLLSQVAVSGVTDIRGGVPGDEGESD